ncbi:DUF5988 family protein [Streptomyces microflavus]|uniref:DUF5988 family protein n=1 Tax=Streptomyces microflavus TaxID=1919 RepID=UPI00365E9FCF
MQKEAAKKEVEVVLSGGPDGVPDRVSVPTAELADRLTVTYLNGREHFEETAECVFIEGRSLSIYRWIYSTKIAE